MLPLTLYAYSDRPLKGIQLRIIDMYASSDASYYSSGDKLIGQTEHSETICIQHNDQMSYRLIVEAADALDSNVEVAVFSGYGMELATMRLKLFILKEQTPSVFRGPFTIPHTVCSSGKQYSVFKNNMAFASQEFVYIWGRNRENNAKRLLLSYPASVDYTSCMVDVCIPENMKDVELVLKSSGGSTWSEGAFLTLFDCVKQTPLLSTTLSQPEEMVLAFPSAVTVATLDIHVTVPTPQDRYLVTLWGMYSGVTTMVGIVYNPFPYYQHVIKRVTVVSNAQETYEVRFVNVYKIEGVSGMSISFSQEEKALGDFTPATRLSSFSLRSSLFCERTAWNMLQLPRTAVQEAWELRCADGHVGYRRRCGEGGVWEAMEGEGCSCEERRDAFGITWKRVGGGTMIQRVCEPPFEGSAVMRCSLEGEWQPQEATCVRRHCPEEPDVAERASSSSGGSSVGGSSVGGVGGVGGSVGVGGVGVGVGVGVVGGWPRTEANATAVQRCADGAVMRERHCSVLGKWEVAREWPCTCPREVAEDVEWPATQSGETASHACNAGYEGKLTRLCSRDGRWGAVTNRCARLFCPAVKDRNVFYPRTPSGEAIDVDCPLPYVGRIERICRLDGSWGYVEDFCTAPSCEHVKVAREQRGCVVVRVADAGAEEQVGVQVLPLLSEESSIVVAPSPVALCSLATNQPYELSVFRYEGTTLRSACVISNVYATQQCEAMAAPILRGVSVSSRGLVRVSVMVEIPFCYDLTLTSLQVKVACVGDCGKKPLLLSHACQEDACQPGSYVIIATQFALDPALQYAIATKPIVAASLLALQQTWSKPLLTHFHSLLPSAQSAQSVQSAPSAQPAPPVQSTQPAPSAQPAQPAQPARVSQPLQTVVGEVTATPKSTHSAKLAWAFSVNGAPLPCSNYLVHVFVSSVLDDTFDPRYLTHIDSQPVCKGAELCTRTNVVIPIARNGLRFVIIVEPVPVCSFQLQVRNTTTAFIAPELPAVDSTVTNYDHYANISFSRANMDVAVNCTVIDAAGFFVSQFTAVVDFGAEVAQIIYGLASAAHYTVACWVRDSFVEPRLFSLAVNTITEVPPTPSIAFVNSSLHYAKVEMRSNREGLFSCRASLVSAAELAAMIAAEGLGMEDAAEEDAEATQDHYVFSLAYATPQQVVTVMIPLGIAFSASFTSQVLVRCAFTPSPSAMSAANKANTIDTASTGSTIDAPTTPPKPIRLKCSAPLNPVPYHPRILHRSVNTRSSLVSSHSVISLSFEAPVMLKRGYGYFFYLVPLQGLGSYYHDHRDAWARDCKKSSGHSVDCAEVDGRSNYTPPIILSEECANNATLITIPLPQIDSGIRYGLKTSLPDMIVDVLANTAIAPDSLDDGFLFTFTSNTGLFIIAYSPPEAPRVFARLLQPADVHRAPLSEPIVVQYSSAGFLPTAVPVQLRRQFGETVLEQAVGQSCVRLARDEAADTTTVTIEVARCLRALQPLTNYEVFIPSTAWKGSTAESPSSFLFSFFTRDEFVSPVLLNVTAEAAHRNERVALKFDQPVRVGGGRVHAEIVDQKNPALVYHAQDESAEAVFAVVDDPFVVWVNLTRFSFYPYATYRLHWEDGALQTTRGADAIGGSASFSTIDEQCEGRGAATAPVLCKYYTVNQRQLCYCFNLF